MHSWKRSCTGCTPRPGSVPAARYSIHCTGQNSGHLPHGKHRFTSMNATSRGRFFFWPISSGVSGIRSSLRRRLMMSMALMLPFPADFALSVKRFKPTTRLRGTCGALQIRSALDVRAVARINDQVVPVFATSGSRPWKTMFNRLNAQFNQLDNSTAIRLVRESSVELGGNWSIPFKNGPTPASRRHLAVLDSKPRDGGDSTTRNALHKESLVLFRDLQDLRQIEFPSLMRGTARQRFWLQSLWRVRKQVRRRRGSAAAPVRRNNETSDADCRHVKVTKSHIRQTDAHELALIARGCVNGSHIETGPAG